MRKAVALLLVAAVSAAFGAILAHIPFGEDKIGVANHYLQNGLSETGAANIVTSVVVTYRGFDTLGEVTILFIAAVGLGALLFSERKPRDEQPKDEASLIVRTGANLLFPLILLTGVYVFIHGDLTPGGGFQGGAVIASGYFFRLVQGLYFKGGQPGRSSRPRMSEAPAGTLIPILVLAGLIIVLGVYPRRLSEVLDLAARELLERGQYIQAVLGVL